MIKDKSSKWCLVALIPWRLILVQFYYSTFLPINPPRPIKAYMRQQTNPSLIQIMACRQFGLKLFSEPMIAFG